MKHKVLIATTLINEEQLDNLAVEGWYLVTIVRFEDSFFFYFRDKD